MGGFGFGYGHGAAGRMRRRRFLFGGNAPASPGRIGDLLASPGNGQVTLTHSAPSANGSPITDYAYRYRIVGAPDWTDHADAVSSVPLAVVTGLVNDADPYEFQARARNDLGDGDWSNVAVATPSATALSKPVVALDFDAFAATIENAETGVSYEAFSVAPSGARTLLGVPAAGNGYTVACAGIGALELVVVATLGGVTRESDAYIFDPDNLIARFDFTALSDRALNGYEGWSASQMTIADGMVKKLANTGTTRAWRDLGGQLVGVKARMRRNASLGTQDSADRNWLELISNAAGTRCLRLQLWHSAFDVFTVGYAGGSLAKSYTGQANGRFNDRDVFEWKPATTADGKRFFQLFHQGVAQITSAIDGYTDRGFEVTDFLAGAAPADTLFFVRATTGNPGVAYPHRLLDQIEFRDYSSAVFSVGSTSYGWPTIHEEALFNARLEYLGAIAEVEVCFRTADGRRISAWETFATGGDGTASIAHHFPEAAYNTPDVYLVGRDKADPDKFFIHAIGTLRAFPLMPTLSDIQWGVNPTAMASWDTGPGALQDPGLVYGLQLIDSANTSISGQVPMLANGRPSGMLPDGAGGFMLKYYESGARREAQDGLGQYTLDPIHDPARWIVDIPSHGGAIANPQIISGGRLRFDVISYGVPSLTVRFRPVSGTSEPEPDGVGFSGYLTTPAAGFPPVDPSKLLRPSMVLGWGRADSNCRVSRFMQWHNSIGLPTPSIVYPFTRETAAALPIQQMLRAVIELDHVMWLSMRHQRSLEYWYRYAIETARIVKATTGYARDLLIEIGNERTNSVPDYIPGNAELFLIAAEGGFITGVERGNMLNEYRVDYIRPRTGQADVQAGKTVPFGQRLVGGMSGYNNMMVECIKEGGATTGDLLPPAGSARGDYGAWRVLATTAELESARDHCAAWLIGELRDIMNTGIVPARPDLSDPSVALEGRARSIHTVLPAQNPSTLGTYLCAGGAGTEHGRRIDYLGTTFYLNIDGFKNYYGAANMAAAVTADPGRRGRRLFQRHGRGFDQQDCSATHAGSDRRADDAGCWCSAQ
ncbi:fibronectin type III domain-containing protein [Sphingobium lignivorans]|uniref:Fibronectin type-III domain-containing protein n=1 Tax=Sphingobium lignivorans TaxID=2735886 RepID=A0ABR6NJK8_9SPHN|nr:fibronectin type III domain-containing protein [Sphingobium lignivorans]MBB5987446.1 hypothetical protein [Sphingobium lignivorans]